jgi:hypothetical protein
MIRMVLASAAAVSILMAAGLPASAQMDNPCAGDIAKFCSTVTPGGGRLLQCYEQNKSQMSTDCVGWVEVLKANAQQLQAACGDMINARCAFEKGDPLAVVNCLQSNYIDLSIVCRNKLNSFKGMYPLPVQ